MLMKRGKINYICHCNHNSLEEMENWCYKPLLSAKEVRCIELCVTASSQT